MSITNKRSRAQRKALLEAREAQALEDIAEQGGLVTLYEPRAGDTAGTCVVRLTSTDGKQKLLTGVSAIQCADMLELHEREQASLADDSPRKWTISKEPVAVPVQQRTGSENLSRERRVEHAIAAAARTPADAYIARGVPARI